MQEIITTDAGAPTNSRKPPRTPAQDELQKKIDENKAKLTFLILKKDNGTASDEELKELKTAKANVKTFENDLGVLIQGRQRQQRKRENDKKIIDELLENNSEAKSKLKRREKEGRPRLEDDQPGLLKAIVDIATFGSGAEERRRSDCIRTVKTLDDLTTELNKQGFEVA